MNYSKQNIINSFKLILVMIGIYMYFIFEYGYNIQDIINNYNFLYILIPLMLPFSIIFFNIIRIRLGKIEINIFGKKFGSGDKLSGNIKLNINKDIKILKGYIYLRGYIYYDNYNEGNGRWEKSYEDFLEIESNTLIKGNSIKNYNFDFDITYLEEESFDKNIFNNTILSKFIKNNTSKDKIGLWKIEVEIEKEGVNMYNEKVVKIIRFIK